MIRILQILYCLKKNGTETFVMNLYRNLDLNNFQFDFLVFSDKKEGYYDEIKNLGGSVFFIPPRRNGFSAYHKNLDKFFKEHAKDYDVVHINGMSHSSIAPIYYAKKYGIPKRIIHIHGSSCQGLHNKLFHKINKYRAPFIGTHFLGCSKNALEWGFSHTPALNKAKLINNGIDLEKFKFNEKARSEYRKQFGVENKFVIIHVGSFNKIKNHSFIIDIFKEINKEKRDSHLFLIGDGPLTEDIKEKVNNLNLSRNVSFLGKRDDIPQLMSMADVMIFPSLHEGLPFVLLEAQASSLPIIASDSISEEVKLSDRILFLPLKESFKKWKDAIMQWENVSRNQEDIAENFKNYSVINTLKQIEQIYKGNER